MRPCIIAVHHIEPVAFENNDATDRAESRHGIELAIAVSKDYGSGESDLYY